MRRSTAVVLAVAAATGIVPLTVARTPSAEGEREIAFPATGGVGPVLEGMLAIPAGGTPAPGAVICHPDPRAGGSMENPIIKDLRAGFARAGFATLRFNFRGVGKSAGAFTDGKTEVDDVLGALAFLRRQAGVDPGRVSVVGYSFGAAMALRAAIRDGTVPACACLGFPTRAADDVASDASFRGIGFPTILVAGTEDMVCRLDALAGIVRTSGAQRWCRIEPIPGADHVLAGVGQRGIAVKRIVRFIRQASVGHPRGEPSSPSSR